MRLVAVAERGVKGIEGALGNPPGLAGEPAPFLHIEAEAGAFVEKACPKEWEKEHGHEVFKHGPRPAGKTAIAVLLELGAAQALPMAQRHLTAGEGNVACEHGLACHQIIPAARPALLFRVIADIEKLPPLIEQRRKVHGVEKSSEPFFQIRLAPAPEGRAGGDESGTEIAAVHGGDKARAQGPEGAGVVPVV